MSEATDFLLRHGHAVVFGWVLAEQLGLPVPAIPVLLAAGALAKGGQISPTVTILAAILASFLADTTWFWIGRRRGVGIMHWLCRISLEPDSCVRRTEEVYARHGARFLLLAKFLPALSTAAPPLAGAFGMRFYRFLLFDTLGTLIWAGAFVLLGVLLSDQLERVVATFGMLGNWLGWASLALGVYLAAKYAHRRRFLRSVRMARISPEELKGRLDAGEDIVIVDLRSSLDFEAEPASIPGSVRVAQDELLEHHERIPRDREIVLFCT